MALFLFDVFRTKKIEFFPAKVLKGLLDCISKECISVYSYDYIHDPVVLPGALIVI